MAFGEHGGAGTVMARASVREKEGETVCVRTYTRHCIYIITFTFTFTFTLYRIHTFYVDCDCAIS